MSGGRSPGRLIASIVAEGRPSPGGKDKGRSRAAALPGVPGLIAPSGRTTYPILTDHPLKVHDGDTITATVLLLREPGGGLATITDLRLAPTRGQYNAPELSEPRGIEARDRLADLLKSPAKLWVEPTGNWSYSRRVGRVFREGGVTGAAMENVADLMVAEGWDVPRPGKR